mgnify:CR=1 FL=1
MGVTATGKICGSLLKAIVKMQVMILALSKRNVPVQMERMKHLVVIPYAVVMVMEKEMNIRECIDRCCLF